MLYRLKGSNLWAAVRSGCVVVVLVASCQVSLAQTRTVEKAASARALSPAAEQVLQEANAASYAKWRELDQAWRTTFQNARSRPRLTAFVRDSLDIFQKLKQVRDLAVDPRVTEARIGKLFRERLIDEDAVCRSVEKSLADFARALEEQDAALFIRLKIDREVARVNLSRSVIDPSRFKQPIATAAAAATAAAQNDISRTLATFVASEAIGMGVKKAARDMGLMPGKPGSFEDFVTGVLIDIGIGMAVDAATDPTPQMVTQLESKLRDAERAILDGQGNSPGFLTTLQRLTDERCAARRRLLEAEASK